MISLKFGRDYEVWLKDTLEALYASYNKREFVKPDPLQFLYNYHDPLDQEIVGIIAATLAYGRVKQILTSVERILHPLGDCPRETLLGLEDQELLRLYSEFKHRFHKGEDCATLLMNVRQLINIYGTLGRALRFGTDTNQGDFVKGASWFVGRIVQGGRGGFMFPNPSRGSASKRLFLYLRWMIRKDDVDLGCWHGLFSPEDLIIPLDIHLFKVSKALGFTKRRVPDLKAAMEVTSCFKKICPEDPVRYDFVLTRFGINPKFSEEALFCLLDRS